MIISPETQQKIDEAYEKEKTHLLQAQQEYPALFALRDALVERRVSLGDIFVDLKITVELGRILTRIIEATEQPKDTQ